jgi:ferric-dicitrate binding protein FerR (iron transport regulator)
VLSPEPRGHFRKARDLAARAADAAERGQAGRPDTSQLPRRRDRRRAAARWNRLLAAIAIVALALVIVALLATHRPVS